MKLSRTYFAGMTLFALAWLVGDHYQPWASFHSEAIALFALWVLFADILKNSKGPVCYPRHFLWLSLILFIPWIQYGFGVILFFGDAAVVSIYGAGFLIAILVGYSVARNDVLCRQNGVPGVMNCLWIVGLVSAVIGLVQWLNLQDHSGPLNLYIVNSRLGDRASGNLAQPNHLATLLLIGIVAFTYFYERGGIGRLPFGLGVALMTTSLILTQSRAGIFSLAMLVIFRIWKDKRFDARLPVRFLFWWAIPFGVGTLALPVLSDALLIGGTRTISSNGPLAERFEMWKQISHALMQSPWIGYGWNQTPLAHAAGAIASPGTVLYTNAHNIVLDLLTWNGIPIGMSLVATVSFWFISRLRSCNDLTSIYTMGCLIPFAVHSMLEYPFTYAYFLVLAGLCVGIVEGKRQIQSSVQLGRGWLVGFFTFWFAIGTLQVYEYFLIEEDFRTVRLVTANIGNKPDSFESPNIWMTSHLHALLKSARVINEPNMKTKDLEVLKTVSQRFSYPTLNCRYALALWQSSDALNARQQMLILKSKYGEKPYESCLKRMRVLGY